MINGIHWWAIILWALVSLFYLALAVHIIISVALDIVLDKFSKAVDLWVKAATNKQDKVRTIN